MRGGHCVSLAKVYTYLVEDILEFLIRYVTVTSIIESRGSQLRAANNQASLLYISTYMLALLR